MAAATSRPPSRALPPGPPGDPHGRRRRRIARQGQDHQQVSRPRLHGARLLWPRPRPAPEGRLGRSRPRLRHALGGRRRLLEAPPRHRRGAQGRPQAHPRHRPRPRGRGDLLAPARSADRPQGRPQGHASRARRLQRHHQVRRHPGDGEAPRRRHGAGRRLPRPPRPRLPRRLPPVAGALAQAARRQVRRPRPVGGAAADRRPRDGDRGLPRPRVLDRQGPPRHPARRHLRCPPRRPRRQEARQVRPRQRGRRHPRRRRDRGPRPRRHGRRVEARHPQPVRPVHDLDAAAGGEPQVRHGRAPDDERRAAALRGRPYHLHAHRRHRHGAGGGDGRPRRDQGPLRSSLRPLLAAHVQEQGQERPGGPRVHPPDRHEFGRRRRWAAWSPTSASSTT